jgi:phosphoribosyl-dephospho-CoA transferase
MEELLTPGAFFRSTDVSPHDLLRIGCAADLRSAHALPAWVHASLERACWVVVRRSLPDEGMVPIGVRGTSREQRFAAYLPIEAILDRVTPEQLVRHGALRGIRRPTDIPAFQGLDLVCQIMSDFDLPWGPTGSVGFEIVTGFPAATAQSDLDLLIRAPYELSRDLCRQVWARLSERFPARIDALIQTGAGAIALVEYAHGDLPILFRSSTGPKLVYRPWGIADECCLHFSRAGISGTGNVAFSAGSSCDRRHT